MADPAEERPARPLAACLLVAAAAAAALVAGLAWTPAPRLVWNASASSPIGLYRVEPGRGARSGAMAVAWPPPAARTLAARRHYLPANVPLVKEVGAAGGDRVCAHGADIMINGRLAARRLRADRTGRALPWWRGCRTLAAGEIFLLSRGVPAAFDGRYFGISRDHEIVGRARLLWPR